MHISTLFSLRVCAMGKRLFLISGLIGIVKNSKFFCVPASKKPLKIICRKNGILKIILFPPFHCEKVEAFLGKSVLKRIL